MIKTIVYSYFKTTQMEDGIISLALLTLIHYITWRRDTASYEAQDCLGPNSKHGALSRKMLRGFRTDRIHCFYRSQEQAWCPTKEDGEGI